MFFQFLKTYLYYIVSLVNAIQRNWVKCNFQRNYFIAKIALNGLFSLIAVNLSRIQSYCDEWDTSAQV